MTRLRPSPRLLAAAALLAAAVLASPAAAQTVRGELVEPDGGAIEQVLVALVDESGRQRAAALTDRLGGFELRAPAPGRYRLRAERVGYATTVSAAFELAAGETRRERLVASGAAVALEGITVESRSRRCAVRPEAGLQTATLWEEARKALNAAAYSQEAFRYEVVQFRRELDARTAAVQKEERTERGALARHPFASPPASELSRDGYVQRKPDATYYYGPDVNVLLSDEFLRDHCLRITDEGAAAGDSLIGVAFEPVRGRDVPEIRGVLWLDRKSAELRRVEYGYVGTRHQVESDRLGGRIEFERLSNGPWIVRRWWIRMPQINVVQGNRTAPRDVDRFQRYEEVQIAAIREEGGEVVRTTNRLGAAVLAAAEAVTLEGVVWDSTRSAPLAGARVYLSGTQMAATTDSAGRFRIEGLGEGTFTVAFSHPELGPMISAIRPKTVALTRGRNATIDLAVPGWRTAAASLCPDSARAVYAGVVVGMVRQAPGGPGIGGARVRASWSRTVVGTGRSRQEERWVESTADRQGFYVLCGVPEERELKLAAINAGRTTVPADLRLASGGAPERRELVLGAGSVALASTQPGRAVAVAPVEGRATSIADFERRRRGGRGVHLSAEEVARRNAQRTTDLFRGIAGVQLYPGPDGTYKIRMAGSQGTRYREEADSRDNDPAMETSAGTVGERIQERLRLQAGGEAEAAGITADMAADPLHAGMGDCPVQFYVDGAPFHPAQEGAIGNEIPPAEIVAIEVYRNAAEVPAELRRGRVDCGVIVIWTRASLRPAASGQSPTP